MLNVKQKIKECKSQGMPNFLIEEHILDLIAQEEESGEEEGEGKNG